MNTILTALLTLFLSVAAMAQTASVTLKEDIRGKSCIGGLGICTPHEAPSDGDPDTRKTFSLIRKSAQSVQLEIEISQLSAEEQQLVFGKPYARITPSDVLEFQQEEMYLFDVDTLRQLGIDTRCRMVRKGSYPITIVKGKALVTLTLSQK